MLIPCILAQSLNFTLLNEANNSPSETKYNAAIESISVPVSPPADEGGCQVLSKQTIAHSDELSINHRDNSSASIAGDSTSNNDAAEIDSLVERDDAGRDDEISDPNIHNDSEAINNLIARDDAIAEPDTNEDSEVIDDLVARENAIAKPNTDEDILFEQIFGQAPPQAQAVQVPFFIGEQKQGQLIILIEAGSARQVQAAPLLQETEDLLQEAIQAQLIAAVDNEGYLALGVLRQVGIVAIFDRSRLELELQIPPALRRTNVVGYAGLPLEAENALQPSSVSGYINFRGSENITWSNAETGGQRDPLRLNVDGALNLGGWVLEGSADWIEASSSPSFTRRDVRLVRDQPSHARRYVLGDFSIPVTGFYQSAMPLGGLSVSRNYDLQPYRVTRPTGEYTFFLERPATVDVLVNGVQVQQLALNAGPQDVRNISLSTGSNDIQLIVTDDLGQIQRLNFSTAVAGDLLAPGIEQFSYNIGFPYKSVNGTRDYDFEQPTVSAAHRAGINERLTLGGYAQANLDYQLLGFDGIFATQMGNLGWEVAASNTHELGADVATRIQYEYAQSGEKNPSNRSFRTAIEYRGENFTTLNTLAPSDYSVDVSAFYRQQIFNDTNLSLSASYRLGRRDPNTYSTNIGLSRTLGDGLSANINVNYRRNVNGEDELQGLLGWNWIFPSRRQSLSLNTQVSNTDEISNRLAWNMRPTHTIQGVGTSVELSQDSNSYDLTGSLNYTDYRYEVALSQDATIYNDGRGNSDHKTRLTFGTALAFADGHFALSRPITNSFVMVAPRAHWQDQTIRVNPDLETALAVADDWGAAVLPDLRPYRVAEIQLEAPDVPLGYDLGDSSYTVLPSYRSGTLIQAGTDASILIRGTLLDNENNALALKAGTIVSLSDPEWQSQVIFTNRVGRFVVTGFKPGRYEIRFENDTPIVFELPENHEGLYDLGELQTLF